MGVCDSACCKCTSNEYDNRSGENSIYGGSYQNKPSETQFTDNLFPPGKNLLCECSNGSFTYPNSLQKNVNHLQQWVKDGVEFQRAETIFKTPDFTVFENGINSSDILQGILGDCYFLSALSALAKTPKLVENLFSEKGKSKNNCYGVKMRINGIWKLIYLDDYFPCIQRQNGFQCCFSRANGNEIWVLLLEKAWAKVCGSYFRIIGGNSGEVFDALCNGYTEYIKFQDDLTKTDNTELIWKKVLEGTKKKYLMGASSYESTQENLNGYKVDNEGIVPTHAYSILQAREKKVQGTVLRLIQLRNPWGNTEWKGAWSDNDNNWDRYNIRNEFGVLNSDEGEFWMDYQNFKRKFIAVTVCHIHKGYQYEVCEVNKQIPSQRPAIFQLKVSSDCHCYVMQHNNSPRLKCEDGNYTQEERAHFLIIDENYNYIGAANSGHYYFGTEVNFSKGGTYYVISDVNYRYNNKNVYGYNISTYSSEKIKIILDNSSDIERILKNCVYNYCKSGHVKGEIDADKLMTYSNKDGNDNDFGFNFVLYENLGNCEYDSTTKIQAQNGISFYFEGDENSKKQISKKILPGQWEVICMMPHGYGTSNYNTQFSYRQYRGPQAPSGCPSLSGKKY